MAKDEREKFLETVKGRKKGGEGEAKSFRAKFRPTGPQEYKDFYDHQENRVKYDVPIDAVVDKKLKIDKEHKSVFVEKRGIYSNPPKDWCSSTPGILFSYFPEEKKQIELKKKK